MQKTLMTLSKKVTIKVINVFEHSKFVLHKKMLNVNLNSGIHMLLNNNKKE